MLLLENKGIKILTLEAITAGFTDEQVQRIDRFSGLTNSLGQLILWVDRFYLVGKQVS